MEDISWFFDAFTSLWPRDMSSTRSLESSVFAALRLCEL
jgi:hypothetical protein